jgi:monoamine oxidase
MVPQSLTHFVIVGAGAAGLMTARELARAGKKVTILEARDRCGGRIYPLPAQEFGYPAEGGAEFVHGAAPVTRALMPGGGTFAVTDRGYSMGCPQRRILAERVWACSCGPTAPGLERVENRFTGR